MSKKIFADHKNGVITFNDYECTSASSRIIEELAHAWHSNSNVEAKDQEKTTGRGRSHASKLYTLYDFRGGAIRRDLTAKQMVKELCHILIGNGYKLINAERYV